MQISGLQKTTLLDYPGQVAATVFLGGCNMRCPFCHNMNLVLNSNDSLYSVEEILSFLSSRKGILDGVCITGGEPTLYPELTDFIKDIRNLGFYVKLDTNGTNPSVLDRLIGSRLVDYVAMDIKSSLREYPLVSGVDNINTDNISQSINLLKKSSTDYEFRTTIIEQYHTEEIINDIGQLLKGAKKYYLQTFVDSDYVPNHSLSACSESTMIRYRDILLSFVDYVGIRGMDI